MRKASKKEIELLHAVCTQQFKIFSASLLTYAHWYFYIPRLSPTVGTLFYNTGQWKTNIQIQLYAMVSYNMKPTTVTAQMSNVWWQIRHQNYHNNETQKPTSASTKWLVLSLQVCSLKELVWKFLQAKQHRNCQLNHKRKIVFLIYQ